MMNRWVALALGGSMGVLMLFVAGSLKLGDMGMKEHMGFQPPVPSAIALSDDGAETMPGRALSDAPSFTMQSVGRKHFTTSALAPDGRILLVPDNAEELVLFDPADGNFEVIDTSEAANPDGYQFYSSVATSDGKIILAPLFASSVGIVDVANQNVEFVDVFNMFEAVEIDFIEEKFWGATQTPDGKVVFAPRTRKSGVGIFDPVSKDLQLVEISHPALFYMYEFYMFSDAVATADSKVVFVPSNIDAVGIFDPATNAFEAVNIGDQISGEEKFMGGALAPNGKVIFAPLDSNGMVGVFDPASKSLELVDISSADIPSYGTMFWGAALAPDGSGKVLFAPLGQNLRVGVFDPATNTFESIDVSAQLSDDTGGRLFSNMVTTPNSQVIFAPYDANLVGILSYLTTASTTSMPTVATTSMLRLKLKLKVKGKVKASLKLKVANGHVNATAKVSSRRRRG